MNVVWMSETTARVVLDDVENVCDSALRVNVDISKAVLATHKESDLKIPILISCLETPPRENPAGGW